MFLQINVLLSYDVAKVRTLLVPCKKSVVDLHSLCGAVSVRWSLPCPKAFTSPGIVFTSPRVVFTSPGLVFTSRRVVKSSRESSQCKSRMCEGKPEFCEDKAENL